MSYTSFGKIFITLIIGYFLIISGNINNAYYFGLKSADNSPENIIQIESKLNIHLPIVSFIFDPREENDVLNSIDHIVDTLGADRIYHFTISPNNYSSEDVVLGKFDTQYSAFFKKIKEKNLHIIFRTMHEMNGGRYSRSSNPERFKAARMHVRTLSRLAGLNEENIAFDFSINHRDMPTKQIPSQEADLIKCTIGKKDCRHFEDYYPGDEFVDVIGVSFYNRGKANSNRQRLTPNQILFDSDRQTFSRLQKLGKPIIIDEVATTKVRYEGNYDFDKTKTEYLGESDRKDIRLHQLFEFMVEHTDIIATIYFNTDYTDELNFQIIGEADRAIVDIQHDKFYNGFRDLHLFGENDINHFLQQIFHVKKLTINNTINYIPISYARETQILSKILDEKTDDNNLKLQLIANLLSIDSQPIQNALKKLYQIYSIVPE